MLYLIFYIVAVVLCGSINFGPISVRVLATCFMIAYLFLRKSKATKQFNIDKSYITIYLIFSLFMGFALILNGEFSKFEFIKKFLAFNLVAIVSFLSIDKIISSYIQLRIVILTLLIIILLNNIVTILQYNGDPIGWAIGYVFGDIDKSVDKISAHDSLLGMSVTPGIFGDVVKNALYIAVITPLSLCIIHKKTNILIIIFSLGLIVSSLVASFMTQQRAAFALVVLTVVIGIYTVFRKKPIILMSLILISGIILLISQDILSQVDVGRLNDSSDTHRGMLAIEAIDFIFDHPFLGGPVSFLKKAGLPAHNFILDTYIYSGLLGFIVMMILFIKTMWHSSRNFFRGIHSKKNEFLIVFSSTTVLFCMAYGFLHNTSFLSGEVIVFILLAIMLKSNRLSYTNINRWPHHCPLPS